MADRPLSSNITRPTFGRDAPWKERYGAMERWHTRRPPHHIRRIEPCSANPSRPPGSARRCRHFESCLGRLVPVDPDGQDHPTRDYPAENHHDPGAELSQRDPGRSGRKKRESPIAADPRAIRAVPRQCVGNARGVSPGWVYATRVRGPSGGGRNRRSFAGPIGMDGVQRAGFRDLGPGVPIVETFVCARWAGGTTEADFRGWTGRRNRALLHRGLPRRSTGPVRPRTRSSAGHPLVRRYGASAGGSKRRIRSGRTRCPAGMARRRASPWGSNSIRSGAWIPGIRDAPTFRRARTNLS
jgi:hypothetical protein